MLVSVATTLSLDRASVDGVSAPWANHPTSADAEPDGATNRYVTTVTVRAGATVEIRLHLHGGSSSRRHRGVTFVHQPLAVDDRVVVTERRGTSVQKVAQFTLHDTRSVRTASA